MDAIKNNWIAFMLSAMLIVGGVRVYELVGQYAVIIVLAWAGVAYSLPLFRDRLDEKQALGHAMTGIALIAALIL